MTFILVHHLLDNTSFLHEFKSCDTPTSFVKCVTFLKSKYSIDNLVYTIMQDGNSCQVYKQTQKTKRGWVWNSHEDHTEVLFNLTSYPSTSTSQQSDVGTQTDELLDSFYNSLLEDVDTFSNNCTYSTSEYPLNSYQNDIYQNDIYQNDFTVGNGYANTLFFPNTFTAELKERLASPNNGLRRTTL